MTRSAPSPLSLSATLTLLHAAASAPAARLPKAPQRRRVSGGRARFNAEGKVEGEDEGPSFSPPSLPVIAAAADADAEEEEEEAEEEDEEEGVAPVDVGVLVKSRSEA